MMMMMMMMVLFLLLLVFLITTQQIIVITSRVRSDLVLIRRRTSTPTDTATCYSYFGS